MLERFTPGEDDAYGALFNLAAFAGDLEFLKKTALSPTPRSGLRRVVWTAIMDLEHASTLGAEVARKVLLEGSFSPWVRTAARDVLGR